MATVQGTAAISVIACRFDPSQGNCPRHKTCTLQASYASTDCSLTTAQLYAPMQPSSDPADSAAAGPATGAILPGVIYGRNVTACGGDAAVVAVGTDIVASVLSTVLLKNMGVPYVVARAHDELHGNTLERIGAEDHADAGRGRQGNQNLPVRFQLEHRCLFYVPDPEVARGGSNIT